MPKVNNDTICVFCGNICEPAPTKKGWLRVKPGEGLHFDCARKVAASGGEIDRLEGKVFCLLCKEECESHPTKRPWKPFGIDSHIHNDCYNKVNPLEGKIPTTHDTVVVAGVDNIITFFKSYHYATQEKEAQRDLDYVTKDKNAFHFWRMGTIEYWKLIHWPPSGKEETMYSIKGKHKPG